MTDNSYVDLFSTLIRRASTSAVNTMGGPKARALDNASRADNVGDVPGNLDYDADGEPPSRFRFGGPLGLPFA